MNVPRLFSHVWLVCAVAASACGSDDPVADADAVTVDTVSPADGDPTVSDSEAAPEVASGWVPASVTDLYGAWENLDDDGTLRRYEFRFLDNQFLDMANATPAYRLLRGTLDDGLTLLERGQFGLQDGPVLDTSPVWALDATQVGKHRLSPFVPASAVDSFALEVVPGVQRVFYRIETFKRLP